MKESNKFSQSPEDLAHEIELSRNLEDLARIGAWELEVDKNRVNLSPGLCKLFRITKCKELTLPELLKFYISFEQDRLHKKINDCISNGEGFLEDFEILTKSGEKIWVKTGGKPVLGNDGRIKKVIGHTQDINQTKIYELKMEEERNILKLAIEISKLGIWSSDDSNTINFDARMREIYGFSVGEKSTTEAVQAKIHGDDRARINALSKESLSKNEPTKFEYRIIPEKNVIRHIKGYLLPELDPTTKEFKRFIGINKDITEKVKGDETNARLLEILDSTSDFITHASIDYEIEYMNRAFKELWEGDEQAVHISSFHPDWANKLIQNVGMPCAIKEGTWTGETALLTKKGEEIPVSQAIICHYNNNKEPKYFSTIMRDMRSTKQMLATLQEQKKILEEVARSKERFLANMSHEIRTPMNGILGFVELLRDEISDPKAEEKLQVIQSSGELLLSIVDDILDFSNIEAGKMSLKAVEFDPLLVIHEVKKLFESDRVQNTNSIQLIDSGFSKDLFIGDPHRFKQLLFNLVSNACKFTKNGMVTIQVQSKAHKEKTVKLKIVVADTGIGISKDRVDQLFKIFSQADESTTRRFGGIGLGLSICKSILDAWQGSISVESVQGKGSSFAIEIPLEFSISGSVQKIKPIKNNPVFPGLKVLIAEDNQVNLKVAQRLLSKLGIEAQSVTDGAQAVEACKKEHFHIVLMDCHMPVMDGFEAAKEISKQSYDGKKPPCIIALTAGVLEEEAKRCLASGMSDVLFKPVNLNRLANMLAKYDPGFARSKKTVA
ncbi:MAG: ATP-binding protein [Oligoflexales bacterium]